MNTQTSPVFVLTYLDDPDGEDRLSEFLDAEAGFFASREEADAFVKAYKESLRGKYEEYRKLFADMFAFTNATSSKDGQGTVTVYHLTFEQWCAFNERIYAVVPLTQHVA